MLLSAFIRDNNIELGRISLDGDNFVVRVDEGLLFNTKWAILQLHFVAMKMKSDSFFLIIQLGPGQNFFLSKGKVTSYFVLGHGRVSHERIRSLWPWSFNLTTRQNKWFRYHTTLSRAELFLSPDSEPSYFKYVLLSVCFFL